MALLIDGVTATDSTKRVFTLTRKHYLGAAVPGLKSRGLGTGDSIRIFEWVDDDWQNTGVTLDPDTTSRPILATGRYAVDAVLATSGPVSCQIDAVNQVDVGT